MIFITLGSQMFQFNRLLKAIDQQIGEGKITDEIFAQTGYSDYTPVNYKYKHFLDRPEFEKMLEKAEIIITHGGTGAIVGALKKNKKVIAVARLAKYDEHVDDHQLQLIKQFMNSDLICGCKNCDELYKVIETAKNTEFTRYVSNTERIIRDIDSFVEDVFLLYKFHLCAVIVVGKGVAFHLAVEDHRVDHPVESGHDIACSVLDDTLHCDPREDFGRIYHGRIDRHIVDVGDHHFVAGNGKVQGRVAHQGDAVRHTGCVLGNAQGVANGVLGVQRIEAYIGIELLHMMYWPGG